MISFKYIGVIEMMPVDMNEQIRSLVKAVSSNLIRAQKEEGRDIARRNRYLEKAGIDSVSLAWLFLKRNDNIASSEYLLSAAYSYETAEAFNQARACYDKIIEIGKQDFLHEARNGLFRLNHLKFDEIDISTKEGKIAALDVLVWKYYGIKTTEAVNYFLEEFDQDVSSNSIRTYAHELKNRKRVVIWGGPQGREYHIYPNIASLATRKQFYGKKALLSGSIESRITENFQINFKNLNYNKELFLLNGSMNPKIVMAVDMDAFVQNLKSLMTPGFPVKAFGVLENFADLAGNGYVTTSKEELDVIDSNTLIDGSTDEPIYNRAAA